MRQILRSSTTIIFGVLTALMLTFGAVLVADAARVRIEWDTSNRTQVSYFQLMRKKDDGPWEPRGELLPAHYTYTYDTQDEPGVYTYSVHALQRDGQLIEPEREGSVSLPVTEVTCQNNTCTAQPLRETQTSSRRCATADWRVGDWGACSVACGGGTQTRSVTRIAQCSGGETSQPQRVRECNQQACDRPSTGASLERSPASETNDPAPEDSTPAAQNNTPREEATTSERREVDTTPPTINTFDFVIDSKLHHYDQNGPLVYGVVPFDTVDIGVIWAAHDAGADVVRAKLFFMTEADFSSCVDTTVDIRVCQEIAGDTHDFLSNTLVNTAQGKSALFSLPFQEVRYVSVLVEDANGNTITDREAGVGPLRVETRPAFELTELTVSPPADDAAPLHVNWQVRGNVARVIGFEVFQKGVNEAVWQKLATIVPNETGSYTLGYQPPQQSGFYFYGVHAVIDHVLPSGHNWLDEKGMSGGVVAPVEIEYVKALPQLPASSRHTTLSATINYVHQGQSAQRSFLEGGTIITNRPTVALDGELWSLYDVAGIALYEVAAAGDGETSANTLFARISGGQKSVDRRAGFATQYRIHTEDHILDMQGRSGAYTLSAVPYGVDQGHNEVLQEERNWQGPLRLLVGMPEQLTLTPDVSAEQAFLKWSFVGVNAATWNAVDHLEVWRKPADASGVWELAPNGRHDTPTGQHEIKDGGVYEYGIHLVANGTYATEQDYGLSPIRIDTDTVRDGESPLLLTAFGVQGIDGDLVYYNGGKGTLSLTTNMNFLTRVDVVRRAGTTIAEVAVYRCEYADVASDSCIANGQQVFSVPRPEFIALSNDQYRFQYVTRWPIADFDVGEHYLGVVVRDERGNVVTQADAGTQRRKVAYGPIRLVVDPADSTDVSLSEFQVNGVALGGTAVAARAGDPLRLTWRMGGSDPVQRMHVAGLGDVKLVRNIITDPHKGVYTVAAPAQGVYRVKLQLWTLAGVGIETPPITLVVQPPRVTAFRAQSFVDEQYVQLDWEIDTITLVDHIDLWRKPKGAPATAWQQVPDEGYTPSRLASSFIDRSVPAFGYFEYGIHVTMKDSGGYFTTEGALRGAPVVNMYHATPRITSVAVNGTAFSDGGVASLPTGKRSALEWEVELGDPALQGDKIRSVIVYFFPASFLKRYGCEVTNCIAATRLARVSITMSDYEIRDNHIRGTIPFDVPELLEAGAGYVGISVGYHEDGFTIYDRDQGKGPVSVNVTWPQ